MVIFIISKSFYVFHLHIYSGVTVIGGLGGTYGGYYFSNYARDNLHLKNPYIFISGFGLAVASICTLIMLVMPVVSAAIIFLLITQLFLWFYSGPIFALTNNCVPSNIRSRASGVQGFVIHILGDAISPTILGAMSDSTNSMRGTFLIIPCVFGVGACVWLCGWRYIVSNGEENGEREKMKQKNSDASRNSISSNNKEDSSSNIVVNNQ